MDSSDVYDPRSDGADCDHCALSVLREGGPVRSELRPGALFTVLAEAPAKKEVEQGRPLVGDSGRELQARLAAAALDRRHISLVNAVSCRCPQNSFELLRKRMREYNKGKKGDARLIEPTHACRPRMLKDLEGATKILTLGAEGYQSLCQSDKAVGAVRGGPVEGYLDDVGNWWDFTPKNPIGGRSVLLLPTIHPAFVLRAPRWRETLQGDVARAIRFFRGDLQPLEFKLRTLPSYEELEAFLRTPQPFFAWDVETDAREPINARLRCVGISTQTEAVVVPFLSRDGYTRFYDPDTEERIKGLIGAFLADPGIRKVGHNAGAYDRLVARHQLHCDYNGDVDTILLHQYVETELPHNLGHVASRYLDVKAWKADRTATTAETDEQLWEYNATDCIVTARITPPLARSVEKRKQTQAVSLAHRVQRVCADMHDIGVLVDQARRLRHDRELLQEATQLRAQVLGLVGKGEAFNPNSGPQIRDLLYGEWDLPPDELTKLGDPSTSDDALRRLRSSPFTSAKQKAFIDALRKLRLAVKLRGTYVRNLLPDSVILEDYDPFAYDEEDTDEVVAERIARNQKKRGLVMRDGRVHSTFNAHGTNTGRLSSQGPNMQNFKKFLRDMIIASPGHIFVAADMDQLELRFASALAGAKRYLEVFARGGDPHNETMESIFGKKVWDLKPEDRKKLRDFAKRFVYAVLYGASVETVHEVITSAEDDKGNLLFADVTLPETRERYNAWLDSNPEFRAWWDKELNDYSVNGFLDDPIVGGRCDFMDGYEDRRTKNKLLNYRCQRGGAMVVFQAMTELAEGPLKMGCYGHNTGLVLNGHDQLMFEVPYRKARDTMGLVEEAMKRKYENLPVWFTATAKAGMRFSEV